MATIGSFKKTGSNEFTGEIVTLSVQAKNVRIVPETSRSGENSPSHRVYCRPSRDRRRLVEALQRGPRLSGPQARRSELHRPDLRQPLRRRGRRRLQPDLVPPERPPQRRLSRPAPTPRPSNRAGFFALVRNARGSRRVHASFGAPLWARRRRLRRFARVLLRADSSRAALLPEAPRRQARRARHDQPREPVRTQYTLTIVGFRFPRSSPLMYCCVKPERSANCSCVRLFSSLMRRTFRPISFRMSMRTGWTATHFVVYPL